MRKYMILATGVVAAPVTAGTLNVTLPRVPVAEYHRPYMAVWVEPTGGGAPRTIAIWYDTNKRGNEPGTKWLSDLRTWWRKAGRNLNLPADGLSGATRAPGTHRIALPNDLRAGSYTLYVEAARENGGRELVSVPLSVPTRDTAGSGRSELGSVSISAR